MLEDCFEYYKGCQDCQKFGKIQRVPASAFNPIIKPWPFRGWGIDLIGQINPPSSKGHKFVLFTKWVQEIPLKKVVGVLDRQTYQGGTRGSRLCGCKESDAR
jgi:hypothetical protein